MKFSVVIPTRHRPAELRACLQRLAPGSQSLDAAHYEVIVSDDGHATAEALIRAEFPWARWTRGPQRGPAANRNHGASLARGEWLAFTDDDCLPTPQWLGSFAAGIADAPAVRVWEGRTFSRELAPGPLRFTPINEQGGKFWSCNLALTRATFVALGGFDAGFPHAHLEDVDFHRRIVAAGLATGFRADAAVEHPPRPVGSAVQQARAHASYFYLARKHHLPLAQAGLSFRAFVRWRLASLAATRSVAEGARFAGRCVVEAACLAVLLPWWALSGRPRP